MAHHFNWTLLIPGVNHDNMHVATLFIVSSLLIFIAFAAYFALGHGENSIVPSGKFSLKGIFEVFVEFIVDMIDGIIGHHGRYLTPLFGSIFLFIFFNNLAGLIPGMTPATDNFNTTVAIGFFSFFVYNILGIKENGLGYPKHIILPIPVDSWWRANIVGRILTSTILNPLFYVSLMVGMIEIVSHLFRPLTLGIRLAANMTADHAVLSEFLHLTGYYLVPIIFYGFGLFVCAVQAYVFTMLSMIYVAMATAHEEH